MDVVRNVGRWRAWLAWLGVPFSEMTLAAALIGAAAAPVFLLAAADLWEVAAADEVTARLVADLREQDAGLIVTVDGILEGDRVSVVNELVTSEMEAISALAPATLAISTPRSTGDLPGGRSARLPIRIVAQDGAIEAIEPIDQAPDTSNGVWISQWFAESHSVGVNDVVTIMSPAEPEDPEADASPVGGPTAAFRVVGVYETLWSVDGPSPEASGVLPSGLVPRYLRPFQAPSFALVLTEPDVLAQSGLSGIAEWHAVLRGFPTSLRETRRLASQYTQLEAALAADPALALAIRNLAGGSRPPGVVSALGATLDSAEAEVRRMALPLGATKIAGVAVGLGIVSAGGVLSVQRRRTEFRLLAGEGDRWPRFALRAAAQLAIPTVLGTAMGVIAGVVVARYAGPADMLTWSAVDFTVVALVALGGVVVAAVTTGLLGQATLLAEPRNLSSLTLTLVLLSIAGAGYLWAQVGRSRPTRPGLVDLPVVALPLATMTASAFVAVVVLTALKFRRRSARRLPVILFLAWRRARGGGSGVRLVAGTVAVAVGLMAFSVLLVRTVDRIIDVKTSAQTGGESFADIVIPPPSTAALPESTTAIAIQQTRSVPGGNALKVVAIDTDTFESAMAWQPEYGGSADQLVQLLETTAGPAVPVVGIRGQSVPVSGSFGTFQRIPYVLVARFDGLPFASDQSPTILVSAGQIDALELRRLAEVMGGRPTDAAVVESFTSPVSRYRPFVASRLEATELERALTDLDVTVRSIVSRSALAASVATVGARFAFAYVRLLGVVGAVAALTGLMLHLSARRRDGALMTVMTRRMGLSSSRAALVVVLEVGLLILVALLATAATVVPLTQRLLPRFDPAPALPPMLPVSVGFREPLLLLTGVVVILAGVWLMERTWGARDEGKILRAID